MTRAWCLWALPAVLLLSPSTVLAGKGDLLPYRVGFSVKYGTQAGAESWREELEFLVVEHMQAQKCFTSVRRFDSENPDPIELLIHVVVTHVEERQNYDISQTELYDPDRPPDSEAVFTLELDAKFRLELRKMPEDVVVRHRRFATRASYRPRFDEDPRYAIRLKTIGDVENALVGLACKGPEKKLVRDIEKALAASR